MDKDFMLAGNSFVARKVYRKENREPEKIQWKKESV